MDKTKKNFQQVTCRENVNDKGGEGHEGASSEAGDGRFNVDAQAYEIERTDMTTEYEEQSWQSWSKAVEQSACCRRTKIKSTR